jgi:hypothetical protein
MSDTSPPLELDLATALGAEAAFATQCFTVYIPNKDLNDAEFGTQRRWVLDAIRLFSEINGGATANSVEGAWRADDGRIIMEHPVIVYSYITNMDRFLANVPRIRNFLHQMGRETNRGEVAFEFDKQFFRIRKFDPSPSS